jgi:hypothetical protein
MGEPHVDDLRFGALDQAQEKQDRQEADPDDSIPRFHGYLLWL